MADSGTKREMFIIKFLLKRSRDMRRAAKAHVPGFPCTFIAADNRTPGTGPVPKEVRASVSRMDEGPVFAGIHGLGAFDAGGGIRDASVLEGR